MINLHCPIAVRLVGPGAPRGSAGDGPLAYDGTREPCTRAGRTVALPAGGADSLRRVFVVVDLRRAGPLQPGRYRVEAVVVANSAGGGPGPFAVAAGHIELP